MILQLTRQSFMQRIVKFNVCSLQYMFSAANGRWEVAAAIQFVYSKQKSAFSFQVLSRGFYLLCDLLLGLNVIFYHYYISPLADNRFYSKKPRITLPSPYTYSLPHLKQSTLFYSLNLNLNQLNRLRTRLDKQCVWRTVEAQPTELDQLRNVDAG